jgi:tRNA threonylcarbamoyladenosine biosynthesis protein TsaE
MHVTIVASPTTIDPTLSLEARDAASQDGVRQYWHTEDDCALDAQQLARVLTPLLQQGASVLIELRGTLGAGKTTFTRHLLRALGVEGRIKSPSYAVVEPYEPQGLPVWHFDFYRFADPREWEDAGFRDIFAGPGLKVVEWPDKAGGLLPAADLLMDLDTDAQGARQVVLRTHTTQGNDILSALLSAGVTSRSTKA